MGADLVVIEDIFWDFSATAKWLNLMKIPYFIQPYLHDIIQYSRTLRGLYAYLLPIIEGRAPENHCLETLLEIPEIVNYSPYYPDAKFLNNREGVLAAKCCLTSDPRESKIVLRYFPDAKVNHNFLTPGQTAGSCDVDDSFLQFSGLVKGSYILQVGRIEMRKNHLTTVMATRNLDVPLVMISYNAMNEHTPFRDTVLKAAVKYRKAPTIVYTNTSPSREEGSLKVIHISKPLSHNQIVSAIGNCGLFLQPSYIELPGYVYLEAAKLGVPTIASSWCSVDEYFKVGGKYTLDDRIAYPLPHHINAIEQHAREMFGKRYSTSDHPIFARTEIDMASDFLAIADKALN